MIYTREIFFCPVIVHIYVIKFQKRGLPHTHMLLIFNCGRKISSTKQVDKIVSCKFPDKNIHFYLHSVIVKHNMHGSCGNLNPKNTCKGKNNCYKNKYPKDYCNSTMFGDNSYPQYRLRNNGIYVKVRGKMLDNQWVVLYNHYLSAKFNCHINVEVCSSIKAVKYLYRYVYKGHDRINFLIGNNNIDKDIDKISTDCNLSFGRKVIVLGGDFRQILSVVPKGNKEDIIKASIIYSYLWPSFVHLALVENMRAKSDPLFCKYLLRIGGGTK